jgi:hypothetical protein
MLLSLAGRPAHVTVSADPERPAIGPARCALALMSRTKEGRCEHRPFPGHRVSRLRQRRLRPNRVG